MPAGANLRTSTEKTGDAGVAVRMMLHVLRWSRGVLDRVQEDLQKEFRPDDRLSNQYHRQTLERFLRDYRRAIHLIQVAECHDARVVYFVGEATGICKGLDVLIMKVSGDDSTGFVQIAQRPVRAAVQRLAELGRRVERESPKLGK